MGRKCAGDSCGLAKVPGAVVKGAMRVPTAFMTRPAGQVPSIEFKFGDPKDGYRTGNGLLGYYSSGLNNSIPLSEETMWATRLLSGTGLTCQSYLALSQDRRQYAIALRYYAMRSHVGERPFNSFRSAMEALNEQERQAAIRDVVWLNQHCVGVEARRVQQAIRATTVAPGIVPYIAKDVVSAKPGGQGFIGSSLGMGSVGQGYIGQSLAPMRPFTFGTTPFPWNASMPYLAPYNDVSQKIPGYWAPGLAYAQYDAYGPAKYFGDYTYPAGFTGTLSPEQRQRMIAVLTPAQLATYQAMTPAQKTTYESDYADAHWDVISGTATTPAQAAQNQAFLGATERALGLVSGTISTAMANNNQQRLAEIRAASDAAIANINAQLQRDLGPTEATRLRGELANYQYTNSLLERQRQDSSKTLMYVGIGVAGLVVVGGIAAIVLTRKPSPARTNPVVGRGRSRHWEKPSTTRRKRRRSRARA